MEHLLRLYVLITGFFLKGVIRENKLGVSKQLESSRKSIRLLLQIDNNDRSLITCEITIGVFCFTYNDR